MDNNLILIGLVIFSIVLIYLLYLNFAKIKDISTLKDEISNLKNSIDSQRSLQSSVTNNLLTKVGELERKIRGPMNNNLPNDTSNELSKDIDEEFVRAANEALLTPPTEVMSIHDDNDDNDIEFENYDSDIDGDIDGEIDDIDGETDLENINDDMEALDKDLDDAIDDLEREIENNDMDTIIPLMQSNELKDELNTEIINELGEIDIITKIPGDINSFFPETNDDDVEEIIISNVTEDGDNQDEGECEGGEEGEGEEEVFKGEDNDEEDVVDELNEIVELNEENLKNHTEANGEHNVIDSIEQLESSSVNLDTLDNIEVDEGNDLEDVNMDKVNSKKYLTALTVRQLKAICREFDIKVRGNKSELIKVIIHHKNNEQ